MEEKKPRFDYIYKIIIVETICIMIMLIGITSVKYFFKGTYKELKVWYEEYLCDETSINEVLEVMDNEI